MQSNIKKNRLLIILLIIFMVNLPFIFTNISINYSSRFNKQEKIKSSGQTLYTKQWLKNNDFSSQDHWFLTKGDQGDNSTINGTISGGKANYKIVGENRTFDLITGGFNSSSWVGW